MWAPVTQKIEKEYLNKVIHKSLQSQKRLCGSFDGHGMLNTWWRKKSIIFNIWFSNVFLVIIVIENIPNFKKRFKKPQQNHHFRVCVHVVRWLICLRHGSVTTSVVKTTEFYYSYKNERKSKICWMER